MKIEKTDGSAPLEIKRCYLPFVLTDFCPECGLEVKKYLEHDYLMYPEFGVPTEIPFYHYVEDTGKDHEWQRMAVVDFTMTEVP